MKQQQKDDDTFTNKDGQNISSEVLATDTASAILAMQTGVHPALQKSLFKVLGRLITVGAEYPVALIENAIRERKAESDSRISIIQASEGQIVNQMRVDPAFAIAAAQKYSERIVRSQLNLNSIASKAVDELKTQAITSRLEDVPEVEDDWLNAFEVEAAQMSSDHAQRIFAKILAGEINRPSTFSKKTLKLMSQLDNRAAEVFRVACSIAIVLRRSGAVVDARVVGFGSVGMNSLSPFGLSYDDCTLLQEYGLVDAALDSKCDYQHVIVQDGQVSCTIAYQNSEWVLVSKSGIKDTFELAGMRFTASGAELLSIVDAQPNQMYTFKLNEHLEQRGMVLHNLNDPLTPTA